MVNCVLETPIIFPWMFPVPQCLSKSGGKYALYRLQLIRRDNKIRQNLSEWIQAVHFRIKWKISGDFNLIFPQLTSFTCFLFIPVFFPLFFPVFPVAVVLPACTNVHVSAMRLGKLKRFPPPVFISRPTAPTLTECEFNKLTQLMLFPNFTSALPGELWKKKKTTPRFAAVMW